MVNDIITNPRLYTDVQGLEELKYQSQTNSDAAIKEVSHQFEAMLLQLVLRSMREANKSFGSDLFGNEQMEMYQDLYDKQLTLALSSNNGTGLAAIIEKNMRQHNNLPAKSDAAGDNTPTQHITDNITPYRAERLATHQHSTPMNDQHDAIAAVANNDKHAINTISTSNPAERTKVQEIFSSAEEFVKKLWPAAKAAASAIGTSPQILLAQAALETNWGKKIIKASDDSSTHNLFNIKSGSSWDDKSVVKETLEQKNGVITKEKAAFRSYASYMDSFMDYVALLKNNIRYNQALKQSDDPHKYMQALQSAGYATDENYADKVLKIFKSQSFKDMTSNLE